MSGFFDLAPFPSALRIAALILVSALGSVVGVTLVVLEAVYMLVLFAAVRLRTFNKLRRARGLRGGFAGGRMLLRLGLRLH